MYHRLGLVAVGIVPLVACKGFDDLASPVVGQGFVLGIEVPDQLEGVDMSILPFERGTAVTMFLANASNADELDDAPIANADVSLRVDQGEPVRASNTGEGVYTILPTDAVPVEYFDDGNWTMIADIPREDQSGRIRTHLPPAGNPAIPQEHAPSTELVAPFTTGQFTGSIVIVADGQSGEVTFTNEPQTIKDVYDMTRGTEPVSGVTIPPRAFPAESVYIVGVAGTTHTEGEDVDGMNSLLSKAMAGKMQLFRVSTVEFPQE